jgi:hypothetical protein
MSEIILHSRLGPDKVTVVDDEDYSVVSRYKWCIHPKGYASARVNGKAMFLHRFIMNPPAWKQIDHINHDKLDNRKSNLRVCTNLENHRNMPKPHHYVGVSINPGATRKIWRARLSNRWLGTFETQEEALAARLKAEKKLWQTSRT